MHCPKDMGPKLFWMVTNCFGQAQIVLVGSKPFWSDPNHFSQVQIRLFWNNFYNLDLFKMNWTRPKQLILDQNHFGPIEVQGMRA